MRLTIQTDYALRVLMYLAATNSRATSPDVARLFGISVHHVAKVVNQLARHGYVRSVRGVGGGIELARSPENIRLGEVIETFEGKLHLLECIGTDNVCALQPHCRLLGVLAEAERLQVEYLNSMTLKDVAPSRRQLAEVAVN